MKVELTIPPEIIRAIAEEVASILKPMMKRLEAPKQKDSLIGVDELAIHLGVYREIGFINGRQISRSLSSGLDT